MVAETQVLVQLTTPESYPLTPSVFPSVTHLRVMRTDMQRARPNSDIDGFLDLWLGKGYLNDGCFYEAPGFAGINIVVEGDDFINLVNSLVGLAGYVCVEFDKILLQALIDNETVDGTVVVNEVE